MTATASMNGKKLIYIKGYGWKSKTVYWSVVNWFLRKFFRIN